MQGDARISHASRARVLRSKNLDRGDFGCPTVDENGERSHLEVLRWNSTQRMRGGFSILFFSEILGYRHLVSEYHELGAACENFMEWVKLEGPVFHTPSF